MDQVQLTEVLRDLAARLGTSVEHIWDVMLRVQFVHGVIWALGFLVCSVVVMVCVRRVHCDWQDDFGGAAVFGAFALLIAFGCGYEMLIHFMVPEYAVFTEIMRMLK